MTDRVDTMIMLETMRELVREVRAMRAELQRLTQHVAERDDEHRNNDLGTMLDRLPPAR